MSEMILGNKKRELEDMMYKVFSLYGDIYKKRASASSSKKVLSFTVIEQSLRELCSVIAETYAEIQSYSEEQLADVDLMNLVNSKIDPYEPSQMQCDKKLMKDKLQELQDISTVDLYNVECENIYKMYWADSSVNTSLANSSIKQIALLSK